ncbi:YraN family protein [Candidatus Saccharibacteria bacterium]|nr:YraN family protein [Candidatus Saccharibacteria bacterium]
MRTTNAGLRAEQVVADYLVKQGWKLLARNWKRTRCEIDVVAKYKRTVYFVEVKFRSTEFQGDGLAYITQNKLKQMKFAAQVWCNDNQWTGDYRLLGASVEPYLEDFRIKEIVDIS